MIYDMLKYTMLIPMDYNSVCHRFVIINIESKCHNPHPYVRVTKIMSKSAMICLTVNISHRTS